MKTVSANQGIRWFIWAIVFIVAALGGLAVYVWYAGETDVSQPVITLPHHRKLPGGLAGQWYSADVRPVENYYADGSTAELRDDFSLNLSVGADGKVSGNYGASHNNGNQVDGCGYHPNGDVCLAGQLNGDVASLIFTYTGDKGQSATGTATVAYNAKTDTLHWIITNATGGLSILPYDLVMYRQSSEMDLTEEMFGTVWTTADVSGETLEFLSSRQNDPAHQAYDYRIKADSQDQEIGYWRASGGQILLTSTKVPAEAQHVSKILTLPQGGWTYPEGIEVYSSAAPKGLRMEPLIP